MFNRTIIVSLLSVFSICAAHATELHLTKINKNSTIEPLLYKTVELLPAIAAKHGIKDLTVTLTDTTNANTANDSMLLGRIDIVVGGINGFIPIYDKDSTKVRLVSGWETFDNWLICTDPKIKSIKDIGPDDKISVKGINAGEHLALRSYLAAELGDNETESLNKNLVVLSRDETFQLMATEKPKIACGLIGSPWQNNIVGMGKAHIVSKPDGKKSFGFPNVTYATKAWLDANPELAKAFVEAEKEAIKEYNSDPISAINVFLKNDGVDDVTAANILTMKKENNDVYDTSLVSALSTMHFMYRLKLVEGASGSLPDTEAVFDSKLVKIN
jgi:NitT/TauT family transport system substrate-binding protein